MTVAAVLVWDLDGTLYRSEEACRHYARGIAETLEDDRRAAYLEALDRYLAGDGGIEASDGWEAAVVLAGGPRASRSFPDAFARTREFMLTDACPLDVPAGLVDFLHGVAGTARRVLMSNTPAFGVLPLLDRLELLPLFDELVCEAGKPNGFARRLAALAEVHDLPNRAVLSIGDHYVNDIEPALAIGCTAAYLDPFRVGPAGNATREAARFEDLLDELAAWVEAHGAHGERLAVAR